MNAPSVIILAAGMGMRMKSSLPKVLHPLFGKPLIEYPLTLCKQLGAKNPTLVVAKDHKVLKEALLEKGHKVTFAVQNPPRGTGHAVQVALPKISPKANYLILYGDMPGISIQTLKNLLETHKRENAELSFVTLTSEKPSHFGRVVRSGNQPFKIVEYKDANAAQKQIHELNVGIYVATGAFLKMALGQLKADNAQKEYYLTDLVQIAFSNRRPIATVSMENPIEAMGVNSQSELAALHTSLLQQKRQSLMDAGVRMLQPALSLIDPSVQIGEGTCIVGPCWISGETKIGSGCTIEPGVVLKDVKVGSGVTLKAYSYCQESTIEDGASIGPFAHLRPGTHLEQKTKVGNFVETKKTRVGKGSKINHLSYVGDATLGKDVNVGAGTITCNYDGVNKFKTVLEDGVFIGSDTQLVAPVKVGKGSFIGAGSTITKNVGAGVLALSRSEQREIKGWKRKR